MKDDYAEIISSQVHKNNNFIMEYLLTEIEMKSNNMNHATMLSVLFLITV